MTQSQGSGWCLTNCRQHLAGGLGQVQQLLCAWTRLARPGVWEVKLSVDILGLRVPTTCVGHSNGKQRLGLPAPNSTHTQSGLLGMICSKNLDFVTTTSLVLQCLFKILIPFSNLRLSHGWRCEELNDVMALEVTLTIGHPAGKSCTRQGAWKGFSGIFFFFGAEEFFRFG